MAFSTETLHHSFGADAWSCHPHLPQLWEADSTHCIRDMGGGQVYPASHPMSRLTWYYLAQVIDFIHVRGCGPLDLKNGANRRHYHEAEGLIHAQ